MATAVIFVGKEAESKGRKRGDWRRDLGKEGRMRGSHRGFDLGVVEKEEEEGWCSGCGVT
jgi:hypothetical protein